MSFVKRLLSRRSYETPAALRKTGVKVKFMYFLSFPASIAWFVLSFSITYKILATYWLVTLVSLWLVFFVFGGVLAWVRRPYRHDFWYEFVTKPFRGFWDLVVLVPYEGLAYFFREAKKDFKEKKLVRTIARIWDFFWSSFEWLFGAAVFLLIVGLLIHSKFGVDGVNIIGQFTDIEPEFFLAFASTFLMPLAIYAAPAIWFETIEAIRTSKVFREWFVIHRGASARWSSINEYERFDFSDFMGWNRSAIDSYWQRSPIYLGKSKWHHDPKWQLKYSPFFTRKFFSYRSWGGRDLGLSTRNHLITVGSNGAGKSVTAAHNVLLSYSGGCFILDPKGEHTMRSYKRRSYYAPAYVLDPFSIVADVAPCSQWNPLDEIDPNSHNAISDIHDIAESLIDIDPKDKHFTQSAVAIMSAVIAHVLTSPDIPDDQRNLGTLRDILVIGSPGQVTADEFKKADIFNKMHENTGVLVDVIQQGLQFLAQVGERERGSFFSTIFRGLRWLSNKPLRQSVARSDFSLSEIKGKSASVYVCVPFSNYAAAKPWMKILTSMAIRVSMRTPLTTPPHRRHRALMLLDEFSRLEYFPPIAQYFNTVRQYDIKIWIFLQNLGQLDWYDNKDDFLGNSDKQFFGVNEPKDVDYIYDHLGEYRLKKRPEQTASGHYEEHLKPLMTKTEIKERLAQHSNEQIVLPLGFAPLWIERVPFWDNFKKSEYGVVRDIADIPKTPPDDPQNGTREQTAPTLKVVSNH